MPQPDVDVRGGGLESQDVPDDEWELTPSGIPLNMVPSVSRDTGLERQDQNDNHDNLPSCEDGYLTDEAASIHSKEPAPFAEVSSERNGTRPRENCAVAVVIPTALPAAQPPQSHKRPSRLRSKTQTYRTDLLNESDEFDDSDDDDYIDRSQHVEHKRRSTKRPKYQPIANSVPMKPQVVGGFQLGNLSLPNLRTVQRGLLTCEFFQSKVVYSFSWTEDRECSDDRSPNEANTPGKEHSGCEMNDIHGWDLHSPSKEENTRIIRDNQRDCHLSTYSSQLKARKTEPEKPRKRNKEWTSEEEDLLRQLKDKDKLLWPQIREFFPNRTEGAIKLRYHTIHKNSAARSRVPSSRAHPDFWTTHPTCGDFQALQQRGNAVVTIWIPTHFDMTVKQQAKAEAQKVTRTEWLPEKELFQAKSIAIRLALVERQQEWTLPEHIGRGRKPMEHQRLTRNTSDKVGGFPQSMLEDGTPVDLLDGA
ncbi:hypothetical protein EIK77_003989 [Talaromyces pinophilus]|nr:hypothetical protein EIK77_003989 [Talaromyces pinophilus]